MTATFETTYGHPPGRNDVRTADEDDLRAARDYGRDFQAFPERVTF
ncbi:hypothetical protein ACIHAR_32050 [Streptomyces sp. NPDC052016]